MVTWNLYDKLVWKVEEVMEFCGSNLSGKLGTLLLN